jgi:hypothetical protein
MQVKLLSDRDLQAMDALLESYGGAKEISHRIEAMRDYQTRKNAADQKGFGNLLDQAKKHIKSFARVEDFVAANSLSFPKKGVCTAQVSGFQGARPTFTCIKKVAEDGNVLFPTEMISVVGLTEEYVYGGDLLTTLALAENILGASKFCTTNLLGTPLPEERFARIEKVTGETFERKDLGGGLSQIILKNMGTPFGNLGGVEVGNNNHLAYLDGITRAAMETGANFFLNPSWSTIVAACYYAREIPNLSFKISMLLSTQNAIQLRMLLNIFKEYIRQDGTTPVYEINIGNAATAETFIQCSEEVEASGLDISLAAHLRINPDLGMADYNWAENAFTVLDAGRNITIKYESDGESRPFDTMEAYFISDEERNDKAEVIGDVIYHKCIRCDKDAKKIMKRGHKTIFTKASYRENESPA